ncbi:MAG: peptidase S10, partial [Wenzhouxiangellaceae bacterium]|nr:peptidase S10 [Wenzhouxiangellaceae bacterium]
MKQLLIALIALIALSLWCPVGADEHDGNDGEEQAVSAEPVAHTTSHRVTIDGNRVEYTATVGWLIMEDNGKPVARFGYTAYTRDGDFAPGERPITFAFNGGPGSSSLWLHMGILGPQRVVVNDAGYADPPPAKRVDNEYSIIDVTDLVMVDPVGTGFSKPLGKAEGKKFWGVDQDIESVAAFIK